ncbi:MAG TPA: hypothetical protein VLA89_05260 [Gemmatimonadales bacterium]|nr:hypothetical protein [Gemmatimonadales bacterium]
MQDIRRGLAANLRTIEDCTVSPWLQENPVRDALSVAGPEKMEYAEGAFGSLASDRGGPLTIIVEGVTSLAGGLRAAQDRFDNWILWEVPEAIESDVRLTSRLNDDGSTTSGQAAACDALAVREFRGYRRERLGNGTDEFLVGDWVIDVLL